MEVFKKIQEAKQNISMTKLEKKGWNDFSKYYYFLPEQISQLVREVCFDLKLLNKFDLVRTDLGLMARLEIIDLDSGKRVSYEMATEIPDITATNAAQQLGGCVTYSERYLLQIAYDIKDNNLDFDSQKPNEKPKTEGKTQAQPKTEEKPWMDEKTKYNIVSAMREAKPAKIGSLTFKDNKAILDYVIGKYRMKKVYREELEEELDSILNQND